MNNSSSYKQFALKALLAAWLFGLFSVVGSAGPNALSVNIGGGQLSASSSDPDTGSITIRVAGPGSFFSQTREASGHASWTLPSGAPDGAYRYDVYASGADSDSADPAGGASSGYRVSGRFLVSGGAISDAAGGDDTASLGGLLQGAGNLLLAIAGAAMPAAYAQDLTAVSGIPTLNFDDTGLINGNIWDMRTIENGANCGGNDSQNLEFRDNTSGAAGLVMSFCAQGEDTTAVPNKDSLIVDQQGDMSLVDGTVFIDRSNGQVGIGTTTPSQEIDIVKAQFPFIQLEETAGTTNTGIGFNNPQIGGIKYIFLDPDGDMNFGSAMYWQHLTNYIGIGVSDPERRLHVAENSSAETVPFFLSNNGGGKVRFLLEANGQRWTFDNTGNNTFAISRIGTGVNELALTGIGNMTIRGTLTEGSSRSTKDRIEQVDPDKVLQQLANLDVHEWSYTGQEPRHIGPMAEDFYALFGFGPDAQHVAPKDMAGVALASAQALKSQVDQQLVTIEAQSEMLDQQKRELDALREKVEEIESVKTQLARLEARLSEQFVSHDASTSAVRLAQASH